MADWYGNVSPGVATASRVTVGVSPGEGVVAGVTRHSSSRTWNAVGRLDMWSDITHASSNSLC